MDGITSERLTQALAALGDQLAMADARVHLVVVGGSGLIAIDAVARTTRDVDVVALEEDGELVCAEPLRGAVHDAAKIVARDLALEPDWLNSGPTGLLVHGLPAGFADRLTAHDFGTALRVSFASRIDQAFLKALSHGRPPRATRLADLRS